MSLNSPFHGDVKPAPSPHAKSADSLRGVETPQLRESADTSVLSTVFYADTDALKWSKAALDSPMGTAIPNPKR